MLDMVCADASPPHRRRPRRMAAGLLLIGVGCAAGGRGPWSALRATTSRASSAAVAVVPAKEPANDTGPAGEGIAAAPAIELAGHREDRPSAGTPIAPVPTDLSDRDGSAGETAAALELAEDLAALEATALAGNPALRRLQQESAAAWARARYANALPDPTIGGSVFGEPMMFADGPMRGDLEVMQMFPWLERLSAQSRQACYEALAAEQTYAAQRLMVLGDLRQRWAQLYLLGQEVRILEANRELLQSLTDLATARIAQNRGSAGDVTLLTIEIGRVEEQLFTARQRIAATQAEINRLAGRPAETPVPLPASLPTDFPAWSHEMLRQTAWKQQPEIAAARLQTHAARWGVEVARLQRRPDVSLRASWMFMDAPGPDPWLVGAQITVPVWNQKYAARQDEATRKNFAAAASVQELEQQYDALLRDLWEQARSSHQIAVLYRETIIPQAEQTLAADQQALANGVVDFDRILNDVRNLLTLQLAYHQAVSQLHISLARIQQAAGRDLTSRGAPRQPPG